jgi:exodeoxyribonuclease VII small subunit
MGRSGRRSARGKQGDAAGDPEAEASGPAEAPIAFESALERLEETVARLEEGEMPLEEALDLFESGVRLSRQCQAQLDRAERRIEILVADRDDDEAVAFDPSEDDEEEVGDASDDEGLED